MILLIPENAEFIGRCQPPLGLYISDHECIVTIPPEQCHLLSYCNQRTHTMALLIHDITHYWRLHHEMSVLRVKKCRWCNGWYVDKRRISLAADYIIRKSVENRSSNYVDEVVGDILVVLEVLCINHCVAVVLCFLAIRILGEFWFCVGQKGGLDSQASWSGVGRAGGGRKSQRAGGGQVVSLMVLPLVEWNER